MIAYFNKLIGEFEGTLTVIDDRQDYLSIRVASGQKLYQKSYWNVGYSPIPPSCDITSEYYVDLNGYPPGNIEAMGSTYYHILPDPIKEKDGVYTRTEIGLHYDENWNYSPGSAGCIVALPRTGTEPGWNDMRKMLNNMRKSGHDLLSLKVQYHKDIISYISPDAQKTQEQYGIPASVTIAQAILETGWGKCKLSKISNNFFGIKGDYHGHSVKMMTKEYINGQWIEVNSKFRSYPTVEDSIKDHAEFLDNNSRYNDAFNHTDDPDQFAKEIHKAGYATDPEYSDKLIETMKANNLYQYDVVSLMPPIPTPIPPDIEYGLIGWPFAHDGKMRIKIDGVFHDIVAMGKDGIKYKKEEIT